MARATSSAPVDAAAAVSEPAGDWLRRSLVMACLCSAGSLVYLLPYLREVYYEPLRLGLGLDHTRFGFLMSAYGTTAMLSYFPGGWLADRIPANRLIGFSAVATGLLAFYLATLPGYPGALAVHAAWGVTTTLTFWGALIKATRVLAGPGGQGRAFGLLEGGRGVVDIAASSLLLAGFAAAGGGAPALVRVIRVLGVLNLVLGVLAWNLIRSPAGGAERLASSGTGLGAILGLRQVWAIGVVILTVYAAYWGTYYFTPWASDVHGASAVDGGRVSVARMWLKPVGALAAGWLADRLGLLRTNASALALLGGSFALLALLPAGAPLRLVVLGAALAALTVFALRGIYFSLLEEATIPRPLTGTVVGIVSVVGYTPDIFFPPIAGALLDALPGGAGYRALFGLTLLLCAVGLVALRYVRPPAAPGPAPA